MNIQYTPKGVCSRQFDIEVEEGVIQSVKVAGANRQHSCLRDGSGTP